MRFSLSTTKMLVNPYVSIYRNNKLRRALNIISISGIKRFQNLSKEITHSIQNSDSCFLYITSDSFTSSQGSNLQLITYSNSFVLNPAKKKKISSFYFYRLIRISLLGEPVIHLLILEPLEWRLIVYYLNHPTLSSQYCCPPS